MASAVEDPANALLRAIRIYGSSSYWGSPRWTPHDQPIEARDVPEPGCRVSIFLGAVPQPIRQAVHVRNCVISSMATRMIDPTRSLDGIIEERLHAQSPPAYEEKQWYVTLVFERRVHLTPEAASQQRHFWWQPAEGEEVSEAFRVEAQQVLDLLAAHASLGLGQEFFEERVTEDDVVVLDGDDHPPSVVPRFTGSAGVATGQGDRASFPAQELANRISSLHWAQYVWLRRAVDWYVTALSTSDPWRLFQSAWFALELLTNKLAERYRSDVLARLEYGTGGSQAVLALAWSEDHAPLAGKFAVMALELDPDSAGADVEDFRTAERGRDMLTHGMITDPADLPNSQTMSLVTKYLDLALQRLLT